MQCPLIHLLLYTITNWMMIRIMCVLRLRVDVMCMNYCANDEYALSVIKILYWCKWNCIEYYKEFICYDGFPRVSYVNICFGLLFHFGLVGCSIVSDLSYSDSGCFGAISWLLSSPPSLILNILFFGFSFYKYVFQFGIDIGTWTVTTTVATC